MAAESIAWYQARIAHLEALVTSRAFLTDYVPRQSLEAERLRADDLWSDLQQAYRALAVAADETRDLREAVTTQDALLDFLCAEVVRLLGVTREAEANRDAWVELWKLAANAVLGLVGERDHLEDHNDHLEEVWAEETARRIEAEAEVARLQETNLFDLYRQEVARRQEAEAEVQVLKSRSPYVGDPAARDAHYDAIIARHEDANGYRVGG